MLVEFEIDDGELLEHPLLHAVGGSLVIEELPLLLLSNVGRVADDDHRRFFGVGIGREAGPCSSQVLIT